LLLMSRIDPLLTDLAPAALEKDTGDLRPDRWQLRLIILQLLDVGERPGTMGTADQRRSLERPVEVFRRRPSCSGVSVFTTRLLRLAGTLAAAKGRRLTPRGATLLSQQLLQLGDLLLRDREHQGAYRPGVRLRCLPEWLHAVVDVVLAAGAAQLAGARDQAARAAGRKAGERPAAMSPPAHLGTREASGQITVR